MYVFFIIDTSLHKTCGHVFRVQFSLGDKRSLSLGELICPFCITILYVNSPLFIDIFHIRALYLCYFVVFCEFYSFTELIIRVRFQLEKAPSEEVSSDRRKNWEKSENEVSSKITEGARRAAIGEPGGSQVTPRCGLPLGCAWWAPRGPTSGTPLAY